ncbi:MAG: glycoside hydrolase [Bacteroidetes bacterium]|nr:glycoside hydrolase [Bacteroidota bacterium]
MAKVRTPARGSSRPELPAQAPRRRRRRKRAWTAYAWLLLLIIPAALFIGRWYVLHQTWMYPSLGVQVPPGFGSVGLDVSRWNGRIQWSDIATSSVRTDFVWIKATEGLDWRDPQYNRNREEALAAGFYTGAYHFFSPSRDPREQARHFWKVAALKPGDLPPVLDLESDAGLSDQELQDRMRTWLDEMRALCACTPVVYTNQHYYRKVLAGTPDTVTLWIAAYERDELPLLEEDHRVLFWQFAQTGRVNGIREETDLNVFAGDTVALREWIEASWQLP